MYEIILNVQTSHFKSRILETGRKLQVLDAQLLDMGTYRCIASNAAGNATKEFTLGILGTLPYVLDTCSISGS